jgi:hypothetical protein
MDVIIKTMRDYVKAECRAIFAELRAEQKAQAEQKAKDMLLTPTEVCEQLRISEVALWRWSKAEYLTPLYIGGKTV